MDFQSTPIAPWPEIDLGSLAATRNGRGKLDFSDAFKAKGKARTNLELLVSGEALCVTTGQQPGLFLGPLYTVYKALSAVAVAERFQTILGKPVVPLFWVAGDDHDFAEGNNTNFLNGEGQLEKLVLRQRAPEDPSLPLYREPVGSEIDRLLPALTDLLPPSEFRDPILAEFAEAYRADTNLAEAFGDALANLLGDFGMPVFMPTAPSAKKHQVATLLRALENAGKLDGELAIKAAAMEREGMKVPVAVGDGATLVMLEAQLGRDRLIIDGDGFKTRRSEEHFSLGDLEAIAKTEPCRLSANVLLRPVLEAELFPTIAYVGGAGELAYFPQSEPVYEILGVAPQAKLPRWSARVMEKKIRKVLLKYSITVEDLEGNVGELETKLAGEDVPSELKAALSSLRSDVSQRYGVIGSVAVTIDPTLKKSVESAKNQTLATAREVEKKIVSHIKQQNETMVRQIGRARAELFPGGEPQERVLNLLPFLTRYGKQFLLDANEACTQFVGLKTAGLQA